MTIRPWNEELAKPRAFEQFMKTVINRLEAIEKLLKEQQPNKFEESNE